MSDEQSERARARVVDTKVFCPLPVGASDLLPDQARRRRALTAALLSSFDAWGYREVLPPLVEYFEVLGLGLGPADRERCVRFIEAGTGKLVALRSDVTPQIARLVAQRVGGTVRADDGMRLCYAATLVRLPGSRHDRTELHQAGVEYVGDPEPSADAELIGLADEALARLGLAHHRFDLSHGGVVRDALAFLDVSPTVERDLRKLLARKDRDGLARALPGHGVRGAAARAFATLAELHGPPALLAGAQRSLRAIGASEAVERLREIVAAVEREHPRSAARLLVDLGEVRGFDYYTGVRVRVWAPGVGAPIVRGGRYDDLVGRYGAGLPATGLAFDLDVLEHALVSAGLTLAGAERPSARLVATSSQRAREQLRAELRAAAVREAASARSHGLRAWIDREPGLAAAQQLAERRGAERLTWFYVEGRGADARVVRQRWRRAKRWRMESNTVMNETGQQS